MYTTEKNNTGLQVKLLDEYGGLLVTENIGRQIEYGTTLDSRIVAQPGGKAREWRIKKTIITWANLLSSISIGIDIGGEITVNRVYSLTYDLHSREKPSPDGKPDAIADWTPSEENVQVPMPSLDITQEVSDFLTPNLHGDSRSYLIIPYLSAANLNGGLYPSLAYIYQQTSDSSFICISVDGRCDAMTENTQVTPADLSGTGMGGWLFYSLTPEDKLGIVPVYNTGNPTDLLSSSIDSMGLVTTFSYGCLTDPDVYDSGVDWRNYTPTDPGNYRSQLCCHVPQTHQRSSHKLVGLRDPKVDPQQSPLSSQKTDYDTLLSQPNGWDTYHVNKLFDKLETEGEQGWVQTTQFTYDDNGNAITKYVSEHQQGHVIFQSWENCSHTSIRGITSLMTAMKLSSVETNRGLPAFQQGDVNFTQYTFNGNSALLETVKRWSDDTGEFLTTTHGFNDYGNEISTTDPAGLTTTTAYDPYFNSLPIQKVEKGSGVNSIQFLHMIWKVASCWPNATGALPTSAKEFLPKVYAASSVLIKPLSDKCILDPVQQYSYDLFKSSAGNSYLTSSTLSYFNDTDIGQHQVLDVIDCVGQKRMQRSRQGVDPASGSTDTHVTWKYWAYDTRGNALFESFNLQSAPWDNFEYQPQPSEGTTSVFDKLDRVLNQARPSHNDSTINVVSSLQYSIGGGTVLETVTRPDPNASATNVVLWLAPRTYVSINGKEHVISVTNQGALTSEFTTMMMARRDFLRWRFILRVKQSNWIPSLPLKKYDERARSSSRALTLADGVEYETVFEYNWQGQVLTKSYPNGATKLNKYIGSLLSYSEVYAEGPGARKSRAIPAHTPLGRDVRASAALFTNVKGNVTHQFKGTDGSLLETISYDDFGTPKIKRVQPNDTSFDKTSTYERKSLDEGAELYDFESRRYGPITGRFTTPDDILAVKDLARTDGLNRLAFENNDPINHSDPSGHRSLSAVLGAALVVGPTTGGAAAPLTATAAGALASGGIAGITYSFDHRNERGGKFWAARCSSSGHRRPCLGRLVFGQWRRIGRGTDFGSKAEEVIGRRGGLLMGACVGFAVAKSEDLPQRAGKWVSKERRAMAICIGRRRRISRACCVWLGPVVLLGLCITT
ncbi:hypothetical protein FGADI_7402 [Fusarium gaditjirri]|uniref:Uncharacterized protein n=1 Tax=Fusarium gaditjirri TaxID=282569 RepID=A0A8H4T5B8_9HYPO|nr:hypothetical protein FGADI_7402 [Fusarium gaditjirri]